jgi:hypothetical protein
MSVQPVSGNADVPAATARAAGVATVWDRVYSIVSVVLSVLLLAQFLFAGLGVFTIVDETGSGKSAARALADADAFWGLHFVNALLVTVVMLVLIGASFAARKPRRTTGLTALLVPLIVLQGALAFTPLPAVAALHVINALVILALALYLVRRSWAFGG